MSPNESSGFQSPDTGAPDTGVPDVEALLKQMKLRGPSEQLDVAIGRLIATDEVNERVVPRGVRFGWTAILATAAAAMLAGIWLGYSFAPAGEKLQRSDLVAVDSSETPQRTPVSFNTQAFNLLHGHSQRAAFKDCGQCHQESVVEDPKLGEVFRGWFYGDEHFFEAHPEGLDDCSKCHLAATEEETGFGKSLQHGFATLVNCSDCHRVDADGFEGFEKDWHSTASSFEG